MEEPATGSAATGGEQAEMRRAAMKTGRAELLLLEVTACATSGRRTPNRGGPAADRGSPTADRMSPYAAALKPSASAGEPLRAVERLCRILRPHWICIAVVRAVADAG
jgi:hypothetical protein